MWSAAVSKGLAPQVGQITLPQFVQQSCCLLYPWSASSESLGQVCICLNPSSKCASFLSSPAHQAQSLHMYVTLTQARPTMPCICLVCRVVLGVYYKCVSVCVCVHAYVYACVRACVCMQWWCVWSVVVGTWRPGGGSVGSCRYVGQGTSVSYGMHSVNLKTVCHVGAGRTGLTRQH